MNIHHLSAKQIQQKLQEGSLASDEVKKHLLQRISRFDDELGAFIYQDSSASSNSASLLAGLPISFKDQFHIKDRPCTFGLNQVTDSDVTAPIVEKLIEQGASILGKTSLPPLAMDFQTSNRIRGFCKNPWNNEYTTGGSSGGGAAAVASGLSFVDIGTDLSGSLRIPASFCGVFSLLPSEGALCSEGLLMDPNLSLPHFARPGPIAREPKDLGLLWEALSSDRKAEIPKKIKLAYWQQADDLPLDDNIKDLMTQAIERWSTAGHKTEYAKPRAFDFREAWKTFGYIMGYETSGLMNPFIRWVSLLSGRASRKRSPVFLDNVMAGYRRNTRDYSLALEKREKLIEDCQPFFTQFDAWIMPVTCCRAFKHITPSSEHGPTRDYKTPLNINGLEINYFDALTAFTTPISLIGHPVVTMPIGVDENGLPVGVQLVGKMNGESELLLIAEELSKSISLPAYPMPESPTSIANLT
ncbi:amidase [Vibrio amylolyticus]|uniref:amidase n=1 Tax=Vibrio amylolyticus TaxID=2847292 RepID=UPI00354F7BB9